MFILSYLATLKFKYNLFSKKSLTDTDVQNFLTVKVKPMYIYQSSLYSVQFCTAGISCLNVVVHALIRITHLK